MINVEHLELISDSVQIVFGRWQEQTCWAWQVVEDICRSGLARPNLYLPTATSAAKTSMHVVLWGQLFYSKPPQLFWLGHCNTQRRGNPPYISRVRCLRSDSELSRVLGQIRT